MAARPTSTGVAPSSSSTSALAAPAGGSAPRRSPASPSPSGPRFSSAKRAEAHRKAHHSHSPEPGSPTPGPGSPSGSPQTGGQEVRITREEVESAFNFFDVSGKGILRPKDLKARLSAFYPNMTNKEYRFLISEQNFTVDTLWSLLENNNITNFDPVREAFKVYDPHGSGFVDPEVLKGIMSRMGYGEMTKEDMEVLIRTADVDGDGRISLDDFKNMLSFNKHSAAGGKSGEHGGAGARFPPPITSPITSDDSEDEGKF